MPAYLIAEHIITDATKFEEYRTKVGPMMAKHGARYLTKGGSHKMPEGGHWKPERVVVIEFPDMNSLNAWYNSPEYKPLKALRKECTSDKICCLCSKVLSDFIEQYTTSSKGGLDAVRHRQDGGNGPL